MKVKFKDCLYHFFFYDVIQTQSFNPHYPHPWENQDQVAPYPQLLLVSLALGLIKCHSHDKSLKPIFSLKSRIKFIPMVGVWCKNLKANQFFFPLTITNYQVQTLPPRNFFVLPI